MKLFPFLLFLEHLPEEDKAKFERIAQNAGNFCEAVKIDPVIDQLYAKEVISRQQNEWLFSAACSTPTSRAEFVLGLIHKSPSNEQAVKDALAETEQAHMLHKLQ